MRARLSLVLAVVTLSLTPDAGRTQPTSGGLLHGRVVVAGDTLPVAGAEVDIVGADRRRTTDAEGRFQFVSVPAGSYTLRVRLPGFMPTTKAFQIADDEWLALPVRLRRLTSSLETVRIEGKVLKVPVRYADVYARAARGWGKFFTRDDIERRQPLDLVSMLTTMPGVLVNDRGLTFQRCREPINGLSAVGARGGGSPGFSADGGSGGAAAPQHVQVYVDGVRRTNRGINLNIPNGPDIVDESMEALREISPSAVQAIEVYSGASQIPGEFLDDACAVIAVWTKSY